MATKTEKKAAKKEKLAAREAEQAEKKKNLKFREMFIDGKVSYVFVGTKLPKIVRNKTINERPMFKEDASGFFGCTEKKWPVRRKILKRMGFKVKLDRPTQIETLEEAIESCGIEDDDPLDVARVSTGFKELDILLGGKDHEKIGFGFPRGTLTVLNGEPGAGKSTLLSQIAEALTLERSVLYITSEETKKQLVNRLRRMAGEKGLTKRQLKFFKLLCTRDIEVAAARMKYADSDVLIVDSIQGFGKEGQASKPKDWKRSFAIVVNYVKTVNPEAVAVAISQVTKDGEMAGPKAFEHDCDINLTLTGNGKLRELEPTKNRYNATTQKVVIKMTEKGLSFEGARTLDRPEYAGTGRENQSEEMGAGWRPVGE